MPDMIFETTLERPTGRTHRLELQVMLDNPEPPLVDAYALRGQRRRAIALRLLPERFDVWQEVDDECRRWADVRRAENRDRDGRL